MVPKSNERKAVEPLMFNAKAIWHWSSKHSHEQNRARLRSMDSYPPKTNHVFGQAQLSFSTNRNQILSQVWWFESSFAMKKNITKTFKPFIEFFKAKNVEMVPQQYVKWQLCRTWCIFIVEMPKHNYFFIFVSRHISNPWLWDDEAIGLPMCYWHLPKMWTLSYSSINWLLFSQKMLRNSGICHLADSLFANYRSICCLKKNLKIKFLNGILKTVKAGSAKVDGKEPKSCLGWVFNFKLVRFAS